MSLVLTTDAVPGRERLEYWRHAVGRALVPMAVTARGEGPFAGRITADRLAGLKVCTVEADAHRASRTAAHVARSSEEFVTVAVQTSGRATLVQDGRCAVAGEGDLLVYDTARPYALEYPERFCARVVQLPRRALPLTEEDVRRVTGTAVGTADGLGAVLMPFLAELVASAHACAPSVAARLAAGTAGLFDALVTERTRQAAEPATAQGALVSRIRDHIDRNLRNPALSPETVAGAHHISVRYLHRLFEDEGVTVSRLIQRRRLEESARELARGGRPAPTVAAVAQRWGFISPAHYSRVFRGAYGVSPRAWRAARTGTERADDAA
ncbi:AraC family transcriptional regulator [Streptomyces fumigatiscleroticus]|nr:AraC family transcriptional regulator [Streptomyces fumigatiscleroticus]